ASGRRSLLLKTGGQRPPLHLRSGSYLRATDSALRLKLRWLEFLQTDIRRCTSVLPRRPSYGLRSCLDQ
ncbi:MAG: hypothetical protein ACRD2P_18930, partial [Terriglobia bacterium]